MERLNPRVQAIWIARALVVAAVLGGGVATIAVLLFGRSPLVGVVPGVVLIVLGVIHAVLRFRAFRYEVQDDALHITRGVLTKVDTVVPYVRVQHVDTQRNPLERLIGLGRVVVYTAGSRGADVAVPGLETNRAVGLQERLRTLAGESEPDDAV